MRISRLFAATCRASILVVALLGFCGLSSAQSFFKLPEVNVFAGYSLQRYDGSPYGFTKPLNLNGGGLEIALPHLYQGLGVAADFSGHWNNELETFNFLIGPQYRFELKGINFFGHFLGGKSRSRLLQLGTSQLRPSSLGRTIAFGGGADIPIGKRFSWRAIEVDYLVNSAFGSYHHDTRYSSGVVIEFGKKSSPPSF